MKGNKVLIIAEAGVNHNGSLTMARQLIDKAAEAGADFIKFQTFVAADLVTKSASKAGYQIKNTKGTRQFEMLKKLELNEQDHVILKKHASLRKIQFLSTAFDEKSIQLLKKLKIKTGKIPSGEITSLPYLVRMAHSFNKIILSTGMSDIAEIDDALKILYKNGVRKKNITVMHCTSEYPAPFENVNLLAVFKFKEVNVASIIFILMVILITIVPYSSNNYKFIILIPFLTITMLFLKNNYVLFNIRKQ